MSDFGASVRQARIHRGLSQAELGEPHYSRSYVSLVETGRRPPSDDLVRHFAARLGLEPELIRSWALAGGDGGTTRAALAQSAMITALSRASYAEASRAASQLSEFALSADRLDLWWTAAILDVDARIEIADAPGAVAAAEALLAHWFTRSSPLLTARVLTALSTALRVTGDGSRAVDVAREAVNCLHGESDPGVAAAALTALVSALAEGGRIEEATALIDQLRASAEETPSRVIAGKAFWALGNLEFMRGKAAAGIRDHERAVQSIDPNHELRHWARLHRASATLRLTYDVGLEAVPDLLAKAESAFDISAAAGDRATLAVVQGQYAVHREDWDVALDKLTFALTDADALFPQNRAQAHQMLATTLQALGEHEEAGKHLTAALDILNPRSRPGPTDLGQVG